MVIIGLILLSSGFFLLLPTWLGVNAIMAIDMWILFNKRSAAIEAATTRKCPHCAELIQLEAKICKHCHRDVTTHSSEDDFERWQREQKAGTTGRTA
jgi:hypothetical protein